MPAVLRRSKAGFPAERQLRQACRAAVLAGSGLRLGLNVQNVSNEDPPIVLTRAGNNFGAYDPSNANILGRTFSFQITKSF